jgi:aspartyl-tRNA(Asn)/glutamyl-tRNA(Gln) amidotransferase subunit C
MAVSEEEVKYIANLARLRFSDEETKKMAGEMNHVLNYMQTLDGVDTGDVEPLRHVIDLEYHPRKDEAKEPLDHEEALKNAPDADSDYFRVPRVIE